MNIILCKTNQDVLGTGGEWRRLWLVNMVSMVQGKDGENG